MAGFQQGSGRGREGRKVQRISSINGRWKIDRGKKIDRGRRSKLQKKYN